MDGRAGFDPVFVEEFPLPDGQMPPVRRFKWIGPGHFETLQNPILAGRSLTWVDVENRAHVVMVTENFAREYFGDPAGAIGKNIGTGSGLSNAYWAEIVGVVSDVRDDEVAQEPVAIVYWPLALNGFWAEPTDLFVTRTMVYTLRSTRTGTAGFLPEVRPAVASVNPNFTVADARAMNILLENSLARTEFTLVMLGLDAAVALLLGAIGVYGVISHVTSLRAREVGIRLALGAESGAVARMVLRQGFSLASSGVAIGLVSAFGLTRLMGSLLYGVEAVDPVSYGTVAVGLVGIALLASYLPARRAARINPTEALRAD